MGASNNGKFPTSMSPIFAIHLVSAKAEISST